MRLTKKSSYLAIFSITSSASCRLIPRSWRNTILVRREKTRLFYSKRAKQVDPLGASDSWAAVKGIPDIHSHPPPTLSDSLTTKKSSTYYLPVGNTALEKNSPRPWAHHSQHFRGICHLTLHNPTPRKSRPSPIFLLPGGS